MKIVRIFFITTVAIIIIGFLFNPLLIGLGDLFSRGHANQIIIRFPAQLQKTFAQKRYEYVPFARIPTCAKNGIISVEDKRFYFNNEIGRAHV